MGLFKKKVDVPNELPDLAIESIKEKINEGAKEKTPVNLENKQVDSMNIVKEYLKDEPPVIKQLIEENNNNGNDKSFFEDILKNLNEEISDLSKLENWYNSKILPQDTVQDMKQYWEGQKSGTILKIVGKDYKAKLVGMITNLHRLEKDWQGIYFNLIEKEEEIRREERELKKILSEFLDACKKSENEKTKAQ